jgi:fructose-specific phosphotransferase system IIC component
VGKTLLGTIPAVSSQAPEQQDWAATTADTIERVVGSIRAKTADPLETIARFVVYGLLAAIVGLAAAVLVAVAAVRGLVVLIDLVWTREVWLAHLLAGGIFTALGLLVWRRRTTKTVKV